MCMSSSEWRSFLTFRWSVNCWWGWQNGTDLGNVVAYTTKHEATMKHKRILQKVVFLRCKKIDKRRRKQRGRQTRKGWYSKMLRMYRWIWNDLIQMSKSRRSMIALVNCFEVLSLSAIWVNPFPPQAVDGVPSKRLNSAKHFRITQCKHIIIWGKQNLFHIYVTVH